MRRSVLLVIIWNLLACVIIISDDLTGPYIQFPILFLVPIALATWYSSPRIGYLFAISLPLVRVYSERFWAVPWTITEDVINALIQTAVFIAFTWLIDRVKQTNARLAHRVQVLEGILPICSFCKRIRDAENHWQPLEAYISEHSAAQFSHGLCPACGREHYGALFDNALPSDRPPSQVP